MSKNVQKVEVVGFFKNDYFNKPSELGHPFLVFYTCPKPFGHIIYGYKIIESSITPAKPSRNVTFEKL